MQKECDLPEELKSTINKSIALFDLRDKYIKRPFGFKNARKAPIEGQEVKSKFWQEIYKLYPELNTNEVWTYNAGKLIVGKEEVG